MKDLAAIQPDTTVCQVQGHVTSDMSGEKVMMSIRNGNYYNLGETGGRIWELLQTPTTVRHIVDTLVQEYDVDPLSCEQHVISFLQRLVDEQLIQAE